MSYAQMVTTCHSNILCDMLRLSDVTTHAGNHVVVAWYVADSIVHYSYA